MSDTLSKTRAAITPLYSDDDFVVTIDNQTPNDMQLSAGTSQQPGTQFSGRSGWADGTTQYDVDAGQTNVVFSVAGPKGWPEGVQGYVIYTIDGNAQLKMMFNSNEGGRNAGDYFYACLQAPPDSTVQDPNPLAYGAQVTGFQFLPGAGTDYPTAYTPTVTVGPLSTMAPQPLTPLTPPSDYQGLMTVSISLDNQTNSAFTLADVIAPLNGPVQPQLAWIVPAATTSLILNGTGAAAVGTTTFEVVYNIGDGVQLTITLPMDNGAMHSNYPAPSLALSGGQAAGQFSLDPGTAQVSIAPVTNNITYAVTITVSQT